MTSTNLLHRTSCNWPSVSALLAVCVVATNASPANEFNAASKEATRNYGTKIGQRYRDAFMKIVEPKLGAAMKGCTRGSPDTKEPAEIIFIVAADGRVKRVLSSPNIPFGECVASKLRTISALPRPPYDSWPAALGVAKHDEQKSAGPPDKPFGMEKGQLAAYDKAIAPYITKARATYPATKKRFLAGLPPGHKFSVRLPLFDRDGKREDSFVEVESIKGRNITGVINTRLVFIADYKTGQRITFPESKIDNWLILRPDGTEEGNAVGKFLDTYKPK